MNLIYWWLIFLATLSLNIMLNDYKFRKISNWQCLFVLILTLPIFLVYGQAISLFYGFCIIILGVVLNQLSILGAGDTKLLAAYSFAIGPDHLWPILFLIVCIGGLLSVVYYIYGRLTNIEKVKQKGVPYGIP
ncbi:A24 family peptidase, partial [Vibrio crassostreae]|uniref:A24 family peptidase n=1 Tax=Vibrio crassostreae TaxID=246167 RepID=UPI00084C4122